MIGSWRSVRDRISSSEGHGIVEIEADEPRPPVVEEGVEPTPVDERHRAGQDELHEAVVVAGTGRFPEE
jgi:hypothetical protein